jgi:hypothetical protein
MMVTAFNTPRNPAWRWRIVNYAGETIEESRDGYPSIGAALAQGAEKLAAMNVVDRSQAVNWRRSTTYLRGR